MKKKIRRERKVQVILEKTIPKLGLVGEVVKVKEGYARNYLLPQGLAVQATEHLKAAVLKRVKLVREQELKEKALAEALAKQLNELSLSFEVKASEEGKLFGSVGPVEVVEALKAKGYDLDKRHVHLEEPIKHLGVYTIALKLHALVQTEIKAWVTREPES